jgi:hypothetical protein
MKGSGKMKMKMKMLNRPRKLRFYFTGLCGASSLQGRVMFPLCQMYPHTAVLSVPSEQVKGCLPAKPGTPWPPSGVITDKNGHQTCYWVLTADATKGVGKRVTLSLSQGVTAKTGQPSKWVSTKGKVLPDLATYYQNLGASAGVTSTETYLKRGASLHLTSGKFKAAGRPTAKFNMVDSLGYFQRGPFVEAIQWESDDVATCWYLNATEGIIGVSGGAIVSISNVVPSFDMTHTADHFQGIFEALCRGDGGPVPPPPTPCLKPIPGEGPFNMTEGINCVPGSRLP